jgi:molybdopterin molybdotransferase
MLTTVEATSAIRRAMQGFDTEQVPLERAVGRVLQQSVHAERDQPPFDRVMMDGIAIRYADFESGATAFPVQSTQMAGDPAHSLEAGNAIEIMTGAALPDGADCIVPVERITVTDGTAEIEAGYESAAGRFIHVRASDHAAGAELLKPGLRVAPADIAIIASAGLPEVTVSKIPAIRVISTGNELVPAGAAIEPHQVRMSNGAAVIAMLNQHGYTDCEHDHLVDEIDVLREHGQGGLRPASTRRTRRRSRVSQGQPATRQAHVVRHRTGRSGRVCIAGQPGIDTRVQPAIRHPRTRAGIGRCSGESGVCGAGPGRGIQP